MACDADIQLNATGDEMVPPSGDASCALAVLQFCAAATVSVRGVEKRAGQLLPKRAPTYQLTEPAGSGTPALVADVVETTMTGALLFVETQRS